MRSCGQNTNLEGQKVDLEGQKDLDGRTVTQATSPPGIGLSLTYTPTTPNFFTSLSFGEKGGGAAP